jgi:hypothetical protein
MLFNSKEDEVKLLAKKLMNFGRDISREALRKMIS